MKTQNKTKKMTFWLLLNVAQQVTEVAKQSGMTQDIRTVDLTIATTSDMQSGDRQQGAEAKHPGRFHAKARRAGRQAGRQRVRAFARASPEAVASMQSDFHSAAQTFSLSR